MVRKSAPPSIDAVLQERVRSPELESVLRKPEGERVATLGKVTRNRNRIASRIAELKRLQEPLDDLIVGFVTAPENASLIKTPRFDYKPSESGKGYSVVVEGAKVVIYTDLDIVGDESMKKIAKRLAKKFKMPLRLFRKFDGRMIIGVLWEERSAHLRAKYLTNGALELKVQARITSPKPKRDGEPVAVTQTAGTQQVQAHVPASTEKEEVQPATNAQTL